MSGLHALSVEATKREWRTLLEDLFPQISESYPFNVHVATPSTPKVPIDVHHFQYDLSRIFDECSNETAESPSIQLCEGWIETKDHSTTSDSIQCVPLCHLNEHSEVKPKQNAQFWMNANEVPKMYLELNEGSMKSGPPPLPRTRSGRPPPYPRRKLPPPPAVQVSDLVGTTSLAARHMTLEEREQVWQKRRIRNRQSLQRSIERRKQVPKRSRGRPMKQPLSKLLPHPRTPLGSASQAHAESSVLRIGERATGERERAQDMSDMGGTTACAARFMTPKERAAVLLKRKIRNRESAHRSVQRRKEATSHQNLN